LEEEKLKDIINGMECPKDFICYETGFQDLCKAKKVGIESYLKCLEKDPELCKFSISFGEIHFCSCPLRVYVNKTLLK
jgi:hypothetical protein